MSHRLFICTTFLVLLFYVSARAQETARTEGSDKTAATATKEKAIDLLSSIAGQVNTLRSAQNRARIGSTTAALLWDIDEKRARQLFAAVGEDIKLGFSEPSPEPEVDPYGYMQSQAKEVFAQLRGNTVERIALHDPQFALDFLRATRPPIKSETTDEVSDAESALELHLAGQIAAKSPELALQLGRESLAKGFSYDLVNVLSQLKSADKALWQEFYKEIFNDLKAANFAEDSWAVDLAIGLVETFPPPQADEQLYRELIGLLVADAMTEGCAGGPTEDNSNVEICRRIGPLMVQVQKYYPSRVAALKTWGQQAAEQEYWARMDEAIEKGSVDEALAEAAKHPEKADRILWLAMLKASAMGDVPRAREIAQKMTNEDLRESMMEQLKYAELRNAENSRRGANPNDPAQGKNNEERAKALVESAMKIGKTDRKTALEQLDQAGQLIESLKAGKSKLEGQIALAILYSSLQSERGFVIVESLMPRINELITAAAALDGIETNYLSDGEWNMTGYGTIGSLTTLLAQNAGYFSRLDFDRSLNLVNQLERPEVRLMAQLMMAQGILSDRNAGGMTLPRN